MHGVVDGAVAPVRPSAANSSGVYWASWITRSAPSHSSSTAGGDVEAAVDGLLVVADVDDRHAVAARPGSRWWHRRGARGAVVTLASPTAWTPSSRVWKRNVAGQVAGAHREVRRAHELAEGLFERAAVVLRRAVDVERGAGPVDRHEERQALHVVPVQVRDEGVAAERAVGGLGGAEEAQAGAEVEDDRARGRAPRWRRTRCCRRSAGWRRTGRASTPARRRMSRSPLHPP